MQTASHEFVGQRCVRLSSLETASPKGYHSARVCVRVCVCVYVRACLVYVLCL